MVQQKCLAIWIGAGVLASSAAAQQIRTQPANGGALAMAAAPTAVCASSIDNQSGGPCLYAASTPYLGALYPLSTDLNVEYGTGHVGMGTTAPLAALHVEGDDGLLVRGTFQGSIVPALGAGTRLHWRPASNSFRVGLVTANQWDFPNVGPSSVAMGIDTIARGFVSTALGFRSEALGQYSVAAGYECIASGEGGVALGVGAHANSYASCAVGRGNVGGGSTSAWVPTDPLFEVGDGNFVTPHNALTVLKNGNVGIGLSDPELRSTSKLRRTRPPPAEEAWRSADWGERTWSSTTTRSWRATTERSRPCRSTTTAET